MIEPRPMMAPRMFNSRINNRPHAPLVAGILWLVAGVVATLAWFFSASTVLLQALLLVILLVPTVMDVIRKKFDLFELRNLFCLGYFVQFVLSTWFSQYVEYRFI